MTFFRTLNAQGIPKLIKASPRKKIREWPYWSIVILFFWVLKGCVIVKAQKHKNQYWAPDLDQWTKSGRGMLKYDKVSIFSLFTSLYF